MTLTIVTNIASMIAQGSLNTATNALNKSIEKLTTGYKINSASDNAAGYSIATNWSAQLSSYDVASDNTAVGTDLLTTAEDSYSLLTEHLQRIRDLTEQAANGTYGSASLKAIQAEIYARFQEIDRIAESTEFNGIKLMKGTGGSTGVRSNGIAIQVGISADSNSQVVLEADLFSDSTVGGLFNDAAVKGTGDTLQTLIKKADKSGAFLLTDLSVAAKKADAEEILAAACSNLIYDKTTKTFTVQSDPAGDASKMLAYIDNALNRISAKVTDIGASSNRLTSATSAIDVQIENLTSSLSTIRDTDVASESSEYVKQQILQQSSATLLSTANQMPSIALQLI